MGNGDHPAADAAISHPDAFPSDEEVPVLADRPRTYPEDGSFPGVIGRTVADSVPAWPEPVRPSAGSPNVLVVLLDDVGFAQLGCYGSNIDTPTFNRLANDGLRYRQFHTTALCSPSRACLLTGRNHHANAMGRLTSMPLGFPGYHGDVPKANGFLSEILRARGYATFALGKWHLTPFDETAAGSPRTSWPLSRGFDRFYGFMRGFTSQWTPNLIYDNHPVAPPRTPEDGYHLNADMADRAIEFISDLRATDPARPFFMYYCPGAGHFPHHVPREWADRYVGRFNLGWDRWRDAVFARQLEKNIVPTNTTLTARPEWIPPWESLTPEWRRIYARQMEVYAGFLEHTDHHIGRVIAFLESLGELDNTVVMVTSDNGADGLGDSRGAEVQGRKLDTDVNLADWGSPNSFPTYCPGWAWAGNTPLRRWKLYLHEGGISDPLIVHWSAGIQARDEMRKQYSHITDIAPTILDILGIEPPATHEGFQQNPMHGVSFAHTFDDPAAPTKRHVQYYEMSGSRAIWLDGWKAVTEQPFGVPLDEETLAEQQWELYRIADDFSESDNLADRHPQKLRQLIELWWAEAGRHQVPPLAHHRAPAPRCQRSRYVYYPATAPVPAGVAADVANRPHRITAHVDIPTDGAEGVIVADGGGPVGGYALYIKNRRLHYVHNPLGIGEDHVSSDTEVPSGTLTVGVQVNPSTYSEGIATLHINERDVGQVEIARRQHERQAAHFGDGLCCGYDAGEPVTSDYHVPFRFTGRIHRVIIEVEQLEDAGPGLTDPADLSAH